ncbi:MAG: flagellar basal-body MS-ring/collar protein FliF [Bacillota bacterium]
MELDKLLGRFLSAWKALDKAKRQLLAIGMIALMGAAVVWVAVSRRGPQYEVLFAGLKLRDSAEIVSWLDSQKVPYKLEASGSSILVPQELVYKLRLQLASQGLPRGGSAGFELLDQSKVTTTDFERRTNYLRALQGELARTIEEIDGVSEARVHIALPEESVFISRTKLASAAVFLKLKPGVELSRAQVTGITRLVSKSVQDLPPENVVVVDYAGRVLKGVEEESSAATGGTPTQVLEIRRQFESTLEEGIKQMLERVVGPGNVSVRASAELNLDRATVSRTMFSPVSNQEGIARSIHQLQESFSGAGSVPAGPAGTTSNIPGYQAQGSAQQSDYTKTEVTRNFEINEVREQVTVAPGVVKRLSVAVLVNRELDANQSRAIESLVAAAIGFDAARKDQITVVGMPFDTSLTDMLRKQMEEAKPTTQPKYPAWLVPAGVAAGGLCLILLLVVFAMARRRRRRAAELADIIQAAPSQAQAVSPPPPPESEAERIRKEIEEIARTNPETVAQLIRTWLSEERR